MKIAELARRTGIATSAVRFYEEVGVLPAAARLANGYREYDEADLARLRLVVALRRLGLAPVDAGRLATVCVERGEIDRDLMPLMLPNPGFQLSKHGFLVHWCAIRMAAMLAKQQPHAYQPSENRQSCQSTRS